MIVKKMHFSLLSSSWRNN